MVHAFARRRTPATELLRPLQMYEIVAGRLKLKIDPANHYVTSKTPVGVRDACHEVLIVGWNEYAEHGARSRLVTALGAYHLSSYHRGDHLLEGGLRTPAGYPLYLRAVALKQRRGPVTVKGSGIFLNVPLPGQLDDPESCFNKIQH